MDSNRAWSADKNYQYFERIGGVADHRKTFLKPRQKLSWPAHRWHYVRTLGVTIPVTDAVKGVFLRLSGRLWASQRSGAVSSLLLTTSRVFILLTHCADFSLLCNNKRRMAGHNSSDDLAGCLFIDQFWRRNRGAPPVNGKLINDGLFYPLPGFFVGYGVTVRLCLITYQ